LECELFIKTIINQRLILTLCDNYKKMERERD
jgi:hypothetical protein